ncbi:MAG: DUF4418 family protein [Proteobacteria bacterium]|nr:DUF4418 family protein [Pseudomonadota bacterium]
MNKRSGSTKWQILGAVTIVLGVLIVAVPWAVFPVCGVGRYAPLDGQLVGHHGCHSTLYAETIIGIIISAIGLVMVIWPRQRTVFVSSISVFILAILAVLFPVAITGVCKMSTMPCRLGTVPALVTGAVLIGAIALVGLAQSRKGR